MAGGGGGLGSLAFRLGVEAVMFREAACQGLAGRSGRVRKQGAPHTRR